MTTFIDIAIHNARVVLLLLVFIFVSGTVAYRDMPKESEPDIAIPILYVSISHEGISPEDAERLLVRPMEKELRTIEGLKEMSASASEGHASIMLEFDAGFNSDEALRDVLQKVDTAKAELPESTEEPVVEEVNVALFPILVVTLAGEVPERTLLKLACDLKDSIEAVPEVLKAEIGGNREEVLEVIVDPLRLESYQLNYDEVYQIFARNNQLVAAGALDTGQGRFNVKVPGVFERIKDVLNLPVKINEQRVIRLKDIGEVRRTFKDPLTFARVNGKPALTLEISKRVGTNIIETIEKTRTVVEKAQQYWPDTIQVNFIQDRSKDVRLMLSDLQNNVITAVLLVSIVIVAVLGLRTAFLVAIAIPGSFLLALVILAGMGLTLNIVVLFSLILASGMLIDGAIIVTEFADRKMLSGLSRTQAYALAAKRMSLPVLGATATTLVVFFPLLFWPGWLGEFMKFLPITIIATLSASLLMALIFMPTLGALMGKPSPVKIPDYDTTPLDTLQGFTGLYVRFIGVLVKYPWFVLLVAILSLFSVYQGYALFGHGKEFFPDVEPEQAVVHVRTRGNLSVYEQDALVKAVEARILDMPELESVYTKSGAIPHDNIPEDTIGEIQLEFINWQLRRPAREIFEEIRQRTADLAGIKIEIRKPPQGMEAGKPIKIEVTAEHPALLDEAVERLVTGLSTIEGLTDIEDNRPLPGVDWKISVDRALASRASADIMSVGQAVQLVTNGILVGEYRPDDADEELDIRIRYAPPYRSLKHLDRLRITTEQGVVPISLFVKRLAQPSVGILRRSDEKRALTVQADVEAGVLVAEKLKEIHAWLAEIPPNPRVTLTFKGEEKDQQEAQAFLSRAFSIAIFIIALILVAQFNNFYQSLLILSAVVLSTMGVLLGLLIMQQPFGIVMSGIGVIALAGIVVNNNIVLIDTFNILRRAQIPPYEAILRTCAQRLRPVLLTTITTILGLMPMVLRINIDFITREITVGAPSTQWWTQLATAVAGGLAFATVLTLVLTPCLLMLSTKAHLNIQFLVANALLKMPITLSNQQDK